VFYVTESYIVKLHLILLRGLTSKTGKAARSVHSKKRCCSNNKNLVLGSMMSGVERREMIQPIELKQLRRTSEKRYTEIQFNAYAQH
jgi:hypothetical protein